MRVALDDGCGVEVGVNGAAAHLVKPGDLVIIFGERDASGSIEASAIDRL